MRIKQNNHLPDNELETRMLVAPDSSMSMAEEIELDDSNMVCSTSPEPEMYYGEFHYGLLHFQTIA